MDMILHHIFTRIRIRSMEMVMFNQDLPFHQLGMLEHLRKQSAAEFKRFNKKEQDFLTKTFFELERLYPEKKNNKMVAK